MNQTLHRLWWSMSTGIDTDDVADRVADALRVAMIFLAVYGFLLAIDLIGDEALQLIGWMTGAAR